MIPTSSHHLQRAFRGRRGTKLCQLVLTATLVAALTGCSATRPAHLAAEKAAAQQEPPSTTDTPPTDTTAAAPRPPPRTTAAVAPNTNAALAPQPLTAPGAQPTPPATAPRTGRGTAFSALQRYVPATIKRYRGAPYRFGANPDKSRGADCSNLISAVVRNSVSKGGFKFEPYYLSTGLIRRNSHPIKRSELRVGDLIYFNRGSATKNHAGVITGISKKGGVVFFHASSSEGATETSTVSDSWKYYWVERFHSYRRWNKSVFATNT